MTETDSSSRPDAPRRWGDMVLKAAAGAVLLVLATMWNSSASDYYKLADVHRQNAAVAVAHALADGGANLDGYPAVPPDVLEFAGGAESLPTFPPVPPEQAEAAVAASTALAAYAATQATEARTDGRLLLSGAGATALAGFGLLYPIASVGAESVVRQGRREIGEWRRLRKSRSREVTTGKAQPA
ncbi:hypothetical protein [Modestobacter sp. KNN46-3]|uniref:hypothetical protein n=1 Tax=Modestobacter sp. KNN46-3 TaxID=2711218 RepID=UPI0013E00372|nr:hypothetical protein [Modestobacter sp. KNN46-3]